MRADDRCAGRTPSHCAAARAAPTLNLKRGERGRATEGGAVNKLRAGPCPRQPAPLHYLRHLPFEPCRFDVTWEYYGRFPNSNSCLIKPEIIDYVAHIVFLFYCT